MRKEKKCFFPTIWYAAVSPDTFSIAPRGPVSLREKYLLNFQQVKYTWDSLDQLYLRAICTCWGVVIAAANPSPVLHHLHAVLGSCVVWFPTRPRCEPKEAAVSPRPDALIVLVVASEPKFFNVFPFHTVQNVFSDGRREDRGQMAILSFAPGFCIIPAIFCRAPKEARIAIFLPAVWAC